MIDRENRAHHRGVRTAGIVNLDRKQQRRPRKTLRILGTQVALVKVERGLSVQFEENVSY
jgi:hypothetical protein